MSESELVLVYTGTDGTTKEFTLLSARLEEAFASEAHAEIILTKEDWLLLKDRIDTRDDEFAVRVDGVEEHAGRFSDVEERSADVSIQLGSWEEDARDAEPTPNVHKFTNASDTTIAADAISKMPTLSSGTVEEVVASISMIFPQSSPAGMLRSLARATGAEVRYNPDKTVDYVATLGTDKSGISTQILSMGDETDEATVEALVAERDARDEPTHIRVLGAGEGDAQISANAISATYSAPARAVWRKIEDKEVSRQEHADKLATAIMAEIDSAPRFLEIRAVGVTIFPIPKLGDTYRVRDRENGIDDNLRVVERSWGLEAGKDQVELLLTNRPLGYSRNKAAAQRQIQAFTGGYQGVSVPINDSGGRQPVDSGLPYVMHVDYPGDVVKELRAKLLVEGLAYRAYSKGAASGGAEVVASEGGGGGVVTSAGGGGGVVTSAGGGGAVVTSDSDDVPHEHLTLAKTEESPSPLHPYRRFNMFQSGVGNVEVDIRAENDVPLSTFQQTVDHTHDVDVPSHTHDVDVPSHTHDVDVPSHTHDVNIPDHTHDPEPGIIEDFSGTKFFPDDVDVVINGTPLGLSLGDGTAAFQEEVDIKGLLTAGFNKIEVTSSQLGHIRVALGLDVFRQVVEE